MRLLEREYFVTNVIGKVKPNLVKNYSKVGGREG